MKGETVRLNFDFPREEYPHLKMVCAQKGVTLKEFASALLIAAIEEYEDQLLLDQANRRLEEMKEEDNISWEEACRRAGWDNGHDDI